MLLELLLRRCSSSSTKYVRLKRLSLKLLGQILELNEGVDNHLIIYTFLIFIFSEGKLSINDRPILDWLLNDIMS